jgi:hypothetical protein
LRRCLRRCWDITSTSRPRPADWVALLFLPVRTSATSGASREAGPRPDSTLLPDLPSLCVWPATPTSTITRTDLTDLRLSLQPSTWRVPVGGCRLGVRSGGPLWCRLGAGVGQRNRWVRQR